MPTKPNLLFIMTDQQRADSLGCYGNSVVQTPNLDSLAKDGFLFENAYVSQPLCTPSRATIMTGLYPNMHGCITNNIPLDNQIKTIAEMISTEYVTGYFGKWHLGDELSPQHGFTQWISTEDQYRAHYSSKRQLLHLSDYHNFLVNNGFTPDSESYGSMVFKRETAANMDEPFTKASFQAQEASHFFRENRDRPFVLYLGFLEPHPPYEGPFNQMYPRNKLDTGPHFLKTPLEKSSLRHQIMADYYMNGGMEELQTESDWREMRARYYGNVTLVDRAVGTILQSLEDNDLSDNTIVVFTSEHGDMLGDHGIYSKMMMYEEAIRVPLIIRSPWHSHESKVVDGRISQVDLVPTLLDLLGQDIPSELQGKSQAPILRGDATLECNDVIVQWNGDEHQDSKTFSINVPEEKTIKVLGHQWRTLITYEGWKMNLSDVDQCELYDLNTDPHELYNMYDDPTQRERIQNMFSRISQWQQRTGDEALFELKT